MNDNSLKETTHENAVLVLKSTGEDVKLQIVRSVVTQTDDEEEANVGMTTAAVVVEPESSPPSSIHGKKFSLKIL